MQSVKSDLQSIFHQYDDIQELFFQGDVSSFDINARDSHGKTLLHHACEYGLTEGVSILLANDAQVDVCDEEHGNIPSHYACENGHLECVHHLMAHSPFKDMKKVLQISNNEGIMPSSINLKTHGGGTILHIACEKGDVFLIKKLLEAGADPNVIDMFGFTPLMRTITSTGTSDTDISSIVTALYNSSSNINAAFLPGLLCSSRMHMRGSTALHMAIAGKIYRPMCIQALIDNGAARDVTDTYGRTPLHIACMWGHYRLIKLLAPSPESLCLNDNDGCTPLYYACKNSHFECIKEFMVQIPDVICNLIKISNKYGATPLTVRVDNDETILHVACKNGYLPIVKKFLEAGADPNVTDEYGFTPLMRAVVSTSKSGITTDVVSSIITALCNSKCSVNTSFVPSKPFDSKIQYCEGSTALHMAIDKLKDNRLCVQTLVDNGAALDARDVHGRTPLHIASIHGHHHLIKLVAPSPESFHFKDNDGCTPLYYACKYSHLECIRKFIVQIPDVIGDLMKVANNDGTTPLCVRTGSGGTILHVACDKGDINLVKKLLEAGADPNVTDVFGFTPLMSVVVSTSKSGITTDVVYPIITALCNSKCSVNASFVPSKPSDSNIQYCEGSTALHMAIDMLKDNRLCVQALVDNGAALDARDVHGRTSLHIASIRGYHHLIELLAPSPESFHFKDNDGCTPLHYAFKYSHLKCIRKFLVQIPDVISDLMKVANNDGTTPLCVRTGSGGTILHIVCEKGEIDLVQKLLEAGADPNVTDEFGFTPLMRAVVSTSKSDITTDVVFSIITALCNSKCSVNASFVPSKPFDSKIQYCEGSTALHMAIDKLKDDRLCVQALVDNGAALDARDVHGRTPLHIASIHGHHHLIKLLALSPESFHFKDNDGCTPLYYAFKYSHLKCIRKFLVQAPDVISDLMKVANNDGTTPLCVRTGSGGTILHVACQKGDETLVQKLLEAGVDPNVTDKFDTTPLSVRTGSGGTILHVACEKGEIDLVQKLLEAGADPNVTDEFGFTPLMRAVVSTSKSGITTDVVSSIITALCNSKCSVNTSFVPSKPFDSKIQYCEGSTALHMAIDKLKDNRLCVQTLVDNGAALDARDVHGRTPLHIASIHGHHHLIKLVAPSPESFHFKDNDGCTPLYYACKYSHLECIRKFIVQIPDVIGDLMKVANNDGTTPLCVRTGSGGTILHVACDKGDINLVKKLLEAGADPNVTDVFGFTPLMSVVVSTSKSGITTDVVYPIITALCNSKCSVNASFVPSKPSDSNIQYCEGSTALHMAIDMLKDNRLCVQALVDNGAALDARDVHGRTSLHIASIRGYHHLIELLAPSPESFHFKDNDGCTPLHYAFKYSHLKCIRKFLVQIPDVISDLMKVANNDGTTPLCVRTGSGGTILHIVCEKGEIDLVQKLLEAGADPNVTDEFGFTPLMRAVVSTSKSDITTDVVFSIITALCNSKCSVNASFVPSKPFDSKIQYCEGSTALHMAIDKLKDDRLCVQALVDNGAALDARDVHGRTPLHIASIRGYHHLIKLLAPSPESFHFKDNDGCTPLYYAFKYSHLECIRKFLVQAPDVISDLMKVANNDGTTPLCVRTGSGGTILHVACQKGDETLVQKLLEAGVDPNVTDKFDTTPLSVRTGSGGTILHVACEKGEIDLVQKLLEAGADPNVTDEFSFTPLSVRTGSGGTVLHVACEKGEIDLVQKLLEAGADPNVTDEFGFTPLSVRTGSGGTILHVACEKGEIDLVQKLLEAGADPNVTDEFGFTPLSVRTGSGGTILHVACEKGDLSIVKKVLEAGADPNSRNGSTFTPLTLAVQHVDDVKAADIIAILCEFKCNINILIYISRPVTALHLACELGKEKCVEMLIAKGANLLVQTQGGLTPLHLACKGGYHTLLSSLITEETLKAYDDKNWTPLHYACGWNHFECVRRIVVGFSKLLLQTHTKYNLSFPSLRDQDGRTILHHACLRHDIQFVENLLNLGADPNVQDNDSATPLMSALQFHGSNVDMNLLSPLLSLDWKPDIKDNRGRTALHYSAKCHDIRIPLMLISAGCDITAVDDNGNTFSDLISKESHQLINKQLLRIDRRKIICVVGYPKCGKTTIIAAFQQAQQNRGRLQKIASLLKFNTRVTLDNSRTSGIDTKVITTKRLGILIFFDFAGQSEYYVSHLTFLESALSAKGSTITFIMMVDLRCTEEDRIAQCKEWLFPIKSILNDHNMLNVILIGSHLDQVGSVSTSTSSLRDTLRELKRTLGAPQMQFIDFWGMDCRQLSSKGMTNLQNYLQSTHPAHSTSVDSSQVPLRASLLFDKLKRSENPPLAITPSKIIDKLKDERPPFPLTVKYIDRCCQDLAASGLVLYIPNREDAGESWLIFEMEEILSHIHGKLFAPDSAEFPMHHKNLANQFGLVHIEELTLAFKGSPLDPEMVQMLLTAMEFCHPIDSSLMTEGILDGLFSKVSSNLHENLLFFPSLVKANEESVILSTESDIPGDDCHWVCWELSTVKPHFLHPRFQQAVFIRLACNHVQKHKSDLSTVEEHSCTVSKNAMSWSTIHGVDVCIQIMHKSTIKVLAKSRPGVKVSSLMELFSSVVSDVLTVRANHAPGVDAYSVFRVMVKGTPGEHTVPVSSIIDVVQAGGMYVNSRERPPKLVSLKDLFLDWEISVTLLEKMVSISEINHYVQTTTEEVCEDAQIGPVIIDGQYNEGKVRFYTLRIIIYSNTYRLGL